MKSIYLKSKRVSDALALATVIAQSEENFHIIRKSIATEVLHGLQNVKIDYYKQIDGEEPIVIEAVKSDRWESKCNKIANLLHISMPISYTPYGGFVKRNDAIDNLLSKDEYILFHLYPHFDQNLDLMMVDRLSKLFLEKGISTISGGSEFLPLIKGTLDFRSLIGINEIFAIKDKIKFLLTSEIDDISIGEALSIPTFIISSIDKLTINGMELSDPYQIFNYINRILTSK